MSEMMRGVHTHDDGRGARRVMCNGVEVNRVVYADTVRGVVRYCTGEIHKHGKRFIERTKRGKVEVYPL